jgi:Uncharacterized protein conserved in bacteria
MATSKPPLPTVLLRHARQMRSGQTEAELKLWSYLRAGRFDGLKFRRQHPIPPYIADLCCVEKRLVVEVDGSQHWPEVDAARTEYLEAGGWRVLRFWGHEVLGQADLVLDAIWNATREPALSPGPSPGGRGELRKKANDDE